MNSNTLSLTTLFFVALFLSFAYTIEVENKVDIPSTPSKTCNVAAYLTKRLDSDSRDQQGKEIRVYDIVVRNTGECGITAVKLAVDTQAVIYSKWNLDEEFNLQNFGGALYPWSNEFSSSGFTLYGSGPVSLSVLSKGCDCQIN
eukprot:TRINITY_DN1965_c2_g1_i1.p1 TRINITY_DN1965_c2_g1~~TRINITY_DN1965_c2_g1_i1.p1  ORF type:complete len:144 (-),score=26.06 TRINITY_DN1965_c2_g1_i1:143-574(-)